MSPLRNTPAAPSRRRHIAALASLAVALFAGSTMTACSNDGPLAPSAPASSPVAAPVGPRNSGLQVGWGYGGGEGGGTELQGSTRAGMKDTPVLTDTVHATTTVTYRK